MRRSRRGPKGSPRRRWAPVCVAGAFLVALLCTAAPAAAAPPAFCLEPYARDYEAPLREMPRQDPPPEGELPFGPRNFVIHRIDRSPVALEGSRFGYRFGAKNESFRVLDLNWRARATALAVSPNGRVRRVVDSRQWRVRRVKDLDPLQIAFPAEHPGFFRIDLRLATLDGRKRASYREHFRVLRRSTDVAIRLNGESFRPGEAVFGLIENRGAGKIIVPGWLELERAEGAAWAKVPQPPSPEFVMRDRWWMWPGEAARCHRFDVPAGTAPGRYRFSASAYVVNEQRRRTIAAEFQVVAP